MMTIWTDPVVERFKALHAENGSFKNIALQMSQEFCIPVSRNAAIGKAKRLGLSSREKHSNVVVTKRKRRVPTGRITHPTRPPTLLDLADKMLASDPAADMPIDQSEFAVVFAQLADPHCRWPLWEADDPEHKYCGAQKLEHSPYCARHHRIAYHQPDRRERFENGKFATPGRAD